VPTRPTDPEIQADPPARRGLHILQTSLLVTGSALLGGLAVALWHRKSLSKLRELNPAPIDEDVERE
jgi:hypothetical protein